MQSIFGTDGIRGRFNEEITYSLAYLENEPKSNKKIIKTEFSTIKKNKNNEITPRSHG